MEMPEGSYSSTELDEHVEIGKYCSIAAHCIFHGADNHPCVANPKAVSTGLWGGMGSKGKIILGNDVWIADGVRIMSGVTIGDGAIVGAGSVVSKNIPPYAVAAGNPARVRKYRFSKEIIDRLLRLKWWDWHSDLVRRAKVEGHFDDIEVFLQLYDKTS